MPPPCGTLKGNMRKHTEVSEFKGAILQAVFPAPPKIAPVIVHPRPAPFDHPDWLFELKYDGFRSLAYVQEESTRLVSRNGNTFKTFPELTEAVGRELAGVSAVLDGEIVCLDERGHPDFNALFYRRGRPYLYAFDLLWLDGRDIRSFPLIERKTLLRRIIPVPHLGRVRYLDHIEGRGCELFKRVCELDIEGIVAKRADSTYSAGARWYKIRNADYSEWGRDEMFDNEPVAELPLWDKCAAACAGT
jgi:bifunctional non-homologous end joining protein LigD